MKGIMVRHFVIVAVLPAAVASKLHSNGANGNGTTHGQAFHLVIEI